MSAFTDRLYLEWAAKNGEVRMLAARPARRRGYGGMPPWERSEARPTPPTVPAAGAVPGLITACPACPEKLSSGQKNLAD